MRNVRFDVRGRVMDEYGFPIYSDSEKRVCAGCVGDEHLKTLLEEKLEDQPCSFCGAEESADVNLVLDAMVPAITAEYTDPAEELMYVSREGGYQGEVLDGSEIVWEVFWGWIENEDLMVELAHAFVGTAWCRRNYYGIDEYEALDYGWREFVEQVKHRTRYLFLQELGDPDRTDPMEIPPGRMLDALGNLMQRFELFRALPEAATLFRVRVHDAHERPDSPDELGPPPRAAAIMANRMSPAGIPMFYGALDEGTAVAETFDPLQGKGKALTVGLFRPTRPLTLLDLTILPAVPSPFDEENRHLQKPIKFLRGFVDDLKKPVERDGYEHVEYVPTQVVTEFVRHRLLSDQGVKLDGMQYTSARKPDGTSVVIFGEAQICGPRDREPWQPDILLTLHSAERRMPDEV